MPVASPTFEFLISRVCSGDLVENLDGSDERQKVGEAWNGAMFLPHGIYGRDSIRVTCWKGSSGEEKELTRIYAAEAEALQNTILSLIHPYDKS